MGPKERILKTDSEDSPNPQIHREQKEKILEEGSVGHDPEVKKRVHMKGRGSGERIQYAGI